MVVVSLCMYITEENTFKQVFKDNGLFGSSKSSKKASEYFLNTVKFLQNQHLNYNLCHKRHC